MSTTTDYVTLATYPDQMGANLALAILKDEGVNAHLADEHTASAASAFAGVTYVRLQVQADQVQRAEELLAQLSQTAISEEDLTRQALGSEGGDWAGEGDPDGDDYGSTTYTCPRCGSSSIAFGPGYYAYIAIMAVTLLAGLTLYTFLDDPGLSLLVVLPGLAILSWGTWRHRQFVRRCRDCDYQGSGESFVPNP